MSYLPCLLSTQEPSRFQANVRPRRFRLNPKHPLANGLVFAGLGNGVGQKYWDYSGVENHGLLTGMEPDSDWVWIPELGRWGLNSNASNSHVLAPSLNRLPTQPLSVSAWINLLTLPSTDTGSGVLYGNQGSNASYAWALQIWNGGGSLGVYYGFNWLGTANMTTRTAGNVVSGTWLHVVATYDGSQTPGGVRIFVNGVDNPIIASAAGSGWYSGTGHTAIAGASYANRPLKGRMTDPLIHSRALSDEEIKQLADPSNAMLSGLIEPEEPDRSISRKRVASYHVIGSGLHERPESFELDYSHPLMRGCLIAGLGRSPKSNIYYNSARHNIPGVLNNLDSPTRWLWEPTLGRLGLDFRDSGLMGGVQFKNVRSRLFPIDAITLAVWVYVVQNSQVFYGRLPAIHLSVYANSTARFASGALSNTSDLTGGSLTTNRWHHVAGTYDGGIQSLYVNGLLVGSRANSGTITLPDSFFDLGGSQGYMSASGNIIADAFFHNRALSPAEIQQLADPSNFLLSGAIKPPPRKYFRGVTLSDAYTLQYRVDHGHERPQAFELDYSHPLMKGCVFAGLGGVTKSSLYQDSSSGKNHGTLTGMDPPSDWVWIPELGRWGLDFDGSNDHVLLPSDGAHDKLVSRTSLTFSAWIKLSTVSTRDMIVSRWVAWSVPLVNDRQVLFEVNLGVLRSYVSTDGSFQSSNLAQGATTLTAGVLYHVACTFQASTQHAVWLNGDIDGSDATPASTMYQGTRNILIGGEQGSNYPDLVQPFHGLIIDPLIHNRVLSPAEIQQLADPSNVLLSGAIKPILSRSSPRPINDRHWVGRTSDYHDASNWSRSRGGPGRAGVPGENHNLYLDALTSEYED